MRFIYFFTIVLFGIVTMNAKAMMQYLPEHLELFKKGGICIGCDLSEVNLSGRYFNHADLTRALLIKANLSHASFYSANFSHAQMMYANLRNIKASGSDFTLADLAESDLSYANFSSCDFTDANLTDVNLSYADLARATISLQQLSLVRSLNCTIMPDGTRHPSEDNAACND